MAGSGMDMGIVTGSGSDLNLYEEVQPIEGDKQYKRG